MARHVASIHRPSPRPAASRIAPGAGFAGATPLAPKPPAAPGLIGSTASAPPAAPAPQPMPWDTGYASAVNNINTKYNNTIADLQYQQAQGEKQFGFNDVSDPYSNLKMLQKHYDEAKRGALNSMAARGQLYSGAAQNAQNYATENYNQGYADQQKKYQDFLHNIETQRLTAANERDTNKDSANYERLMTALQNRPDAAATEDPAATTTPKSPRVYKTLKSFSGTARRKAKR